MAKVDKKPPEPREGAKMKKKQHKTAQNPKHSSMQKTKCCCYCHQILKIIMKKKQPVRRTTRRKASMKAIQMRIPKKPSETALALLIREETGENDDNPNAPEQSQPGLGSSRVFVEDLTSSKTQSTDEDPKNINA